MDDFTLNSRGPANAKSRVTTRRRNIKFWQPYLASSSSVMLYNDREFQEIIMCPVFRPVSAEY